MIRLLYIKQHLFPSLPQHHMSMDQTARKVELATGKALNKGKGCKHTGTSKIHPHSGQCPLGGHIYVCKVVTMQTFIRHNGACLNRISELLVQTSCRYIFLNYLISLNL